MDVNPIVHKDKCRTLYFEADVDVFHIQASKATIYELAFPISAVLFDLIINKNILSKSQGLGAIIIITSMILITSMKSNKK